MSMKLTPKMTIQALRLLKMHPEVIEDGYDAEDKEALQGVAAMYLSVKAAGKTDLEFPEWYETFDVNELDEEDEADADPSPSKSTKR